MIAHTMPRAVMTEGLPLPPRLGEMQVVCLVLENTASTSLTVTPVPQQLEQRITIVPVELRTTVLGGHITTTQRGQESAIGRKQRLTNVGSER